MIDLSRMKAIRVDSDARTALIEGGVVCAELDAATQAHGLATPSPTVSSVGVVGAALGGGSGYLSRKFGLLADNVISVNLVTADGARVRASHEENPDLFWAVRGGGGNFGVATSLELVLHEVGPEVLSGQIIYPFDDAVNLLRFFREFISHAPDEFQCYPFMFRIPPIEVFPEDVHGQPVLDFVLYHEDPGAADFVQPLRELGKPILDLVAPTMYAQVQQGFDANLPSGQRYYSKAHNLADMSDGVINTVVEYVPQMLGAFTGAIGRVAPSATPYGGREAAYGFHCLAGWVAPTEDEAVMTWASAFHEAMAAHATGGVYVNLIAEDEDDRVPAAYGENYSRLLQLKRQWDPHNLFRTNYNIPPG
jgi:FAD/FMN-containing dehydrogenase